MKNELDTLLQRKMDRKDFVKHVAIGFVALTGIGAIIKSMSGAPGSQKGRVGYGASVYGGRKK